MVPGFSVTWFSQVIMGVVTPAAESANDMWAQSVGGPYELQWCRYLFRNLCAGGQQLFRSLDLPISVWLNAFNNTSFTFLREMVLKYFVRYDTKEKNKPYVPKALAWVNSVSTASNMSIPKDSCGDTLFNWICLPSGGFGGVLTRALGNVIVIYGTIPCLLNDVWMHAVRNRGGKRTVEDILFPPPLTYLCGMSDDSTSICQTVVGTSIPLTSKEQARAIGTSENATLHYKTKWNQRLIWHMFPTLAPFIAHTDGTPVPPLVVPRIAEYVFQKRQVADASIPTYIATQIQTTMSCWFPALDDTGMRLAVFVPPINVDLMTQTVAGVAYAKVNTWAVGGETIAPTTMTGGGKGTDPLDKYEDKGGGTAAPSEQAKP
jgi:hypothetical protein